MPAMINANINYSNINVNNNLDVEKNSLGQIKDCSSNDQKAAGASTYLKSSLFSVEYLKHLNQYSAIDPATKIDLIENALGFAGEFGYNLPVPKLWHLDDIARIGDRIIFYFTSQTEQAACPKCKTVSHHRTNTYEIRWIQDFSSTGMTVYYCLKSNRFSCENQECPAETFVEQFPDIAGKRARMTNRLKDLLAYHAIEATCIGSSRLLARLGIKASRDTINRQTKKMGALAIEQNLKRDDVKALSVDDFNLRKGNSSTACSNFIDEVTHRFLLIAEGTTSETAEKVMKQFPSADTVSRDRGSAFSAAAAKLDKKQVADGFHLVENAHKAIKDALYQEVAPDLFVKSGDGWTPISDNSNENHAFLGSEPNCGDSLVVAGSVTLAPEDVENRIHLAGLTAKQADKYKKTIDILEMTERGLRTSEIAKKLSLKTIDVCNYRKHAPQTLEKVELKIDEYFKMREKGQWEYHQQTISKNARPSSKSIVEPYKETVLKLFNEGKNHRKIHPIIAQLGFQGCANAVYQFLIKYSHENNIPYGRNSRVIPVEERDAQNAASRPPRIAIERVSRHTIYKNALHDAATKREEIERSLLGSDAVVEDSQDKNTQESAEWSNKTNYPDDVAKIIFDTTPKEKTTKRKLNADTVKRIEAAYPIIPRLIMFLVAFYEVLVTVSVEKLDAFISTYKNDSMEALAIFASGLEKDYVAVKNDLLYPNISNGPMEGTNNKIKMVRRRSYGRAKLELLNAIMALSWFYRDLDATSA